MRTWIALLMFVFAQALAHAQGPVSAAVSKNTVAVGETFRLQITANGANVDEPDTQVLKSMGVSLGRPSQSTSTNVQIINGATSMVQTKSWTYPMRAARRGTIEIPPIPVRVDGKNYLTQPVTVEVTDAVQPSGAGQGGGEITVDALAFVESAVDKTEVFQGESVTLTLRVYVLDENGVNLEGPRTIPMPALQGFYSGQQSQQNTRAVKNGRNYRVNEITQKLFPTMPGALTIDSWSWQGVVYWPSQNMFRQSSAVRDFFTPPITINATPLPDRPSDFSGAVGKYSIRGELPAREMMQGVPVKWRITIQGEGNPDAVGAPKLPDVPWAHLAGPEVEMKPDGTNGEPAKYFTYTLTPLETGEHTLPQVSFVFFAPIIKNYKTESTPEVKVSVLPAQDAEPMVAIGGSAEEKRASVELLNDDFYPIITETAELGPAGSRSVRSVLFIMGMVLPPVLFAVFALVLRKRRRLDSDEAYKRRYYAWDRFAGRLDGASGSASLADTLYQALSEYVADSLGLPGAGLTSVEIRGALEKAGVEQALAQSCADMLRACERARYAGDSFTGDEEEALLSGARHVAEKLRREFKKEAKQ